MVAREAVQDLPSPPPAFVAFAQAWQAWQALRCPCGGALPTTFVRPTLLPTILPVVAYNPFADMLGGQDQDTAPCHTDATCFTFRVQPEQAGGGGKNMLVIVTGWAEGRNTTLVILLTNRTLCKRWSWIKLILILESL